ncbi:MAG: hypothetical protein J2P26_00605 [Nocardiopsaceae bacterium]|nr:hypothetical protein [Nocardiopsaceae bacterium]
MTQHDHWHYATTKPSDANPAVIETVVGPETNLSKTDAKRALQPLIRAAQGRVRYEHPDTGQLIEPADWWTESDKLVWIGPFPEGPITLWAVYPCTAGDCAASAVRHRDDVAAHIGQPGLLDVTVEPVHKFN